MTTVDSSISSISSQLQSLQQTVAKAQSGSVSDPMKSFLAALSSFDTAASQTLSALSAGSSQSSANSTASTTSQTSSNSSSTTIAASTMSALLAATSAGTSSSSSTSSSKTTGTAHLLPAGSSPDTENKPDMADFMAATGADVDTACDVLYGTIGSNKDLRDWKAIMASKDPVADARASTAAMYNSTLDFVSPDATQPLSKDVFARSGNFEYANIPMDLYSNGTQVMVPTLIFVDGQGNHLTNAGGPEDLLNSSTNFGFDTSALANLEAQLDAKNVKFRTGSWANGFLG